MTKHIKIQCAWCKKELGKKKVASSTGNITHGICSPCLIKSTNFESRTASDILDLIREPVFVIDSSGTVRASNKNGRKMLGKEGNDIKDHLGGDAFECSYAKTPGGCGRTVHCKTCSIRNTVMATLNTGQNYLNVPAFQSIDTDAGTKILKFHISTEKVGENVFLRIDDVTDSSI